MIDPERAIQLECTIMQLTADLQTLASVAWELGEPYSRSLASSWRTHRAATLFIIVTRYLDAASHYAAGFPDARTLPTEPLATLVRGLMEACDALHYAYLDVMPKAEAELRQIVGTLHYQREESEFRRLLQLSKGDWSRSALAGFFAQEALSDNPVFKALPEPRQREMRIARRARSALLPRRTLPFGWSVDETEGVYKFLSNFAHSTTWSEYGAAIRATDQVGTKSALLVATHVAAWTIERYCRHLFGSKRRAAWCRPLRRFSPER